MHRIAIILDGVPSDATLTWHWVRCVLVPAAVILFLRGTFRAKKKSFLASLALCTVAAAVVLRPAYDLINWGWPFFPQWWFVAAPWVCALLPFVAVAFMTVRSKRLLLAASLNSGADPVEQRAVQIACSAAAIGLICLFFRYRWAHVGTEAKFVACWSLAAFLSCCAVVLAMRRLKRGMTRNEVANGS